MANDVSSVNGTQGATIQSLAFDRNGVLYGIGQSAIYSVNRTSGVLTKTVDFSLDIRGFEFAVPEPGSCWLLATVAAIASCRLPKRRLSC
jgi:hypothetical protein